jgi:hypothetical protein
MDARGQWTIRWKETSGEAMDSSWDDGLSVGRVEIFQEFRWISLTGIFVSFDWLKKKYFIPSAFLHLWIYSFVCRATGGGF